MQSVPPVLSALARATLLTLSTAGNRGLEIGLTGALRGSIRAHEARIATDTNEEQER